VSPQLSPELVRGLLNVARSLLVATRNWTLYPPEHPAVQSSVERFCDAVRESSLGSAFGVGITPDSLLIDGVAPAHIDGVVAEAAALLHDRDLVHITFLGEVSPDGAARLLRLLNVDAGERRRSGGPAKMWALLGHPSIVLEQILQPLLRKGDPRVARAAVSALGVIADPAAARAVHTILRSATGEVRRAVIEALVGDRDARVVPMLVQIVGESDALGTDHDVVLETLTALGAVGTDAAVAPIVAAVQVRSFWRRKKARAVKQRGVDALARIGSDRARAAIDEAGKSGDRALKALAQAASI
jgi:HEAT repeat protein